jgi:4-hydroxy-tetrahydrodipicolinate reductase
VNIALIGYGKMGKIIEGLALEQGDRIVAAADPDGGEKTASGAALYKSAAEFPDAGENRIDAALEFTGPGAVLDNIKVLAARRIPVVVGSTGWLDRLGEAEAVVKAAGSSLLWAPNFSLGVNLFYRIAAFAAKLLDPFPGYDAAGWEIHHNKKADSPSGTAKTLAELVMKNMGRKTQAVYETLNRPPPAGGASLRQPAAGGRSRSPPPYL